MTQVHYNNQGYTKTTPRPDRFAILGNFNSGTDAIVSEEIAKLRRAALALKIAPSYKIIAQLRQINHALDRLIAENC